MRTRLFIITLFFIILFVSCENSVEVIDVSYDLLFLKQIEGKTDIVKSEENGGLVNLTSSSGNESYMQLSDDFSKLVYVSDKNSHYSTEENKNTIDQSWDIYLYDFNNNSERQLTKNLGADHFPIISPDLQKIYYCSNQNENQDIYSMNIDGTEQTNLSNNLHFDYGIDVSPDGSRLLFGSDRNGYRALFTMGIDGSDVIQIAGTPDFEIYDAQYSPDGKLIVFEANSDIFLLNLDNRWSVNLTNSEEEEETLPSFSPTGEQIIYYLHRSINKYSKSKIYEMDLTSYKTTALTKTWGVYASCSFSKDGTRLCFQRETSSTSPQIIIMDLISKHSQIVTDGHSPILYD